MGLFLESLPPTVAYDGNGPLDLGQWQRRPFPFLIFEQDALKKWFSYRIVCKSRRNVGFDKRQHEIFHNSLVDSFELLLINDAQNKSTWGNSITSSILGYFFLLKCLAR